MSEEKYKVVFAPGCFDDFEGTQEELDKLISDINMLFNSGDFDKEQLSIEMVDTDIHPRRVLN